ncbi:hypothetical protein Y032_0155g3074 [Ancylostoma ceylanicum]|uniref:G-protein coupled receptors family 1 profile domain-containing protein n=1 Tax=Ancylostoma ceylanicum TaxID=53326 RepID=A0A016SZS7_9BILA|nr:hypothetical protein Y032_0155g3074 [Ancylostoma ceylanicum]
MQDNQIVALVIFSISFIGTVANFIVATSTQRLPSMRNAFGLLMTSQSSGEAVLCAIFAFYYSPMVFFNIQAMEPFSRRFGIVLLMCYDICIFSHLFIALNRMFAICFPWSYEKYFSHTNTKILIVISWSVSIVRCLISYGFFDCDFVYDGSIWVYVFTRTKDCTFISLYLDFYKDLSVVVVIAAVDMITVIRVHVTSMQLRKTGQCETDERRKREINFLKQAVLQGMVFVVELYTYFHLAWQVHDRWAVWLLTTVAWNLVHCTDALIIIGLNGEYRKLISSPTRIFRSRSIVHNSSTNAAVRGGGGTYIK